MTRTFVVPGTHKNHSRVQNPASLAVHLVGESDPAVTLCSHVVRDNWKYLQVERITCEFCLRGCYRIADEHDDLEDIGYGGGIEIEITPEISIYR